MRTDQQIKGSIRQMNQQGLQEVRGMSINQSNDFNHQQIQNIMGSLNANQVLLESGSELDTLRKFKDILCTLSQEVLNGNEQFVMPNDKRDDWNKRMILMEGQIDGLMRRKIDHSSLDGQRVLDYSSVFNEKENQIVELEKKINNLEERLRRANAKQVELENHIERIFADSRRKDELIQARNQIILAEVAASNAYRETMNRLKRNMDTNKARIGDAQKLIMEGIQFPDVGSFDIKADLLMKDGAQPRNTAYQNQSQNQKYKTQLVQFFRQFERINNSQDGITDLEMEKAFEGFLLNLNGTRIRESVSQAMEHRKITDEYERFKTQFGVAVGLIQNQMTALRQSSGQVNSGARLELDAQVLELLKTHKVDVLQIGNTVQLERLTERVIEVPVQDARTKHLVHMLASEMKRLSTKYPKLLEELDGRLVQFFQQEIIDIIEVDEVDRLVSIVKYVPQVVKVENVYAYSSEKSRKVEFHLRVLIKALLEELEKVKTRTGVALELDEGVVGMINQEIMGVVNVDDILKVFRVVPKIVEVEKIVERIVDRIIEVPQIVTVEKIVQRIVEIEKIREVEKIVNVPIEIPNVVINNVEKIVQVEHLVEKIIEVPQIIEKIVEVIVEVPKIVEVERIVDRIVEVEKIIEVERKENHIQPQIQQVQTVSEKIVTVERIVEKIVEVPVIVEKIVELIREVPQIIEVEKIVEKIVPQIEYRNAKETEILIEVRYEVVDRIVEKPVHIIKIQERIVEVPQIIEKIVTLTNTVTEIKQVEVIVEKMVIQKVIQTIEVMVDRPVVTVKEVIKEVERIIKVPVIHEKLVRVTEIVEKPIIQRIENTTIKEVYIREPLIVYEPKIVEVHDVVNHYIEVYKPFKYIEEKIVEVIKHVDRIKEIKVPVEKIIEKIVEVPKVVEVERIVEKIIVVPRVVEKIVEVPQIIERIVPKIIIEERIKEVERIVQVPVFQERPYEVEVTKNVFVEVPNIVERVVDKVVEVPSYEEKIVTHELNVERVVELIKEVPVSMQVEKIVHVNIQVPMIVETTKEVIVPVEVPLPVQLIKEKAVPIIEIHEKLKQEIQIMERIVPVIQEQVRVEEVVRFQEKILVHKEYQKVVQEKPIFVDKIVEVEVIREKIVPIRSVVQELKTAQQIVEKIVTNTTTVSKVVEVERCYEKIVEVPKIVEVERIIPQLINVNRYIQTIVEKIVDVPIIMERVKEVLKENDKIVTVIDRQEFIKEVERNVERTVVMEKFKEVVRNINHIEKVLQIVDRLEQIPVGITSIEERLVEVPYILEKIVEKIVVMPQIVEVLKYVHEVIESESLGVAVTADVASHEQKYKMLSQDIKLNLDLLLKELIKLKSTTPNLKITIEMIERFLAELSQFILFPRIVQVPKEVIVEKEVERERIVKVGGTDERSHRMELTLSLLVEKLILELKRVKREKPDWVFNLDEDVKLIFMADLGTNSNMVNEEFNGQLSSYCLSMNRKFQSLGSWTTDQQMMLNSFLQERFMMANLVKNANLEIEKVKSMSVSSQEGAAKWKSQFNMLEGSMSKLRSGLSQMQPEVQLILTSFFKDFDSIVQGGRTTQITYNLMDLEITDQRIASLIRQKDIEMNMLRDKMIKLEKSKGFNGYSVESHEKAMEVLREENTKLRNENNMLRVERGSVDLISSYKAQINSLNEQILGLEQEKSNLSAQLYNLRSEYKVKLAIYEKQGDVFKRSDATAGGDHSKYEFRSPNDKNFDSSIDMTSPEYIKMVDSQIQGGNSSSSTSRPIFGQSATSKQGERSDVKNYDRQSSSVRSETSQSKEGSTSGASYQAVNTTQYGTATQNLSSRTPIDTSSAFASTQLKGSGVEGRNTSASTYQSSLTGAGSTLTQSGSNMRGVTNSFESSATTNLSQAGTGRSTNYTAGTFTGSQAGGASYATNLAGNQGTSGYAVSSTINQLGGISSQLAGQTGVSGASGFQSSTGSTGGYTSQLSGYSPQMTALNTQALQGTGFNASSTIQSSNYTSSTNYGTNQTTGYSMAASTSSMKSDGQTSAGNLQSRITPGSQIGGQGTTQGTTQGGYQSTQSPFPTNQSNLGSRFNSGSQFPGNQRPQ